MIQFFSVTSKNKAIWANRFRNGFAKIPYRAYTHTMWHKNNFPTWFQRCQPVLTSSKSFSEVLLSALRMSAGTSIVFCCWIGRKHDPRRKITSTRTVHVHECAHYLYSTVYCMSCMYVLKWFEIAVWLTCIDSWRIQAHMGELINLHTGTCINLQYS